jgi:signal transduction histidine kinase
VREAVGNAARHGGAQSIEVTLTREHQFRLTVEDDGAGLPEKAPNGRGFGLVSMRDRAEVLGGTLEIAPGGERGVRVEVILP